MRPDELSGIPPRDLLSFLRALSAHPAIGDDCMVLHLPEFDGDDAFALDVEAYIVIATLAEGRYSIGPSLKRMAETAMTYGATLSFEMCKVAGERQGVVEFGSSTHGKAA